MAASRAGSRWWQWIALGFLVVGLAACAGSGYTFVSSKSTRTFLKVPDSWKVFDKEAVLSHPSPYLVSDKADRFLVAFDADPKPSLKHSFVTGDYPFGQVRVRELDLSEHDQYSFSTLRNEFIPLDSLLEQNQKSVELLAPARLLTHQGLRGSQLEYAVHLSKSTFSVSQVGFVDPATHTVWFIAVGCSDKCYRAHKAAIHRVIESWTVEGK